MEAWRCRPGRRRREPRELVDILDVGNAEPPRGGTGGLAVRSRHSGQLDARHLRKLLKGVEAESSAANYAQSNFS